MKWYIVLFYQYAKVDDVNKLKLCIEDLCKEYKLLGRVIIANEGINGNLAVENEKDINDFCEKLNALKCFKKFKIDFKMDTSFEKPFPDLFINTKKEICSIGGVPMKLLDDGMGGKHLHPKEFHAILKEYWENSNTDSKNPKELNKNKKPLVVLDVRNNIEYNTGRFMNVATNKEALNPETKSFSRWIPDFADKAIKDLKDKKVLMYCTGGIRCEKASAYLKEKGVEDVSQLQGGIHRYLEEFGSKGFFQGSNFVFDSRALQKPNDAKVIGRCHNCCNATEKISCDRVCAVCREPVLVCDECSLKLYGVYYCKLHYSLKGIYEPFLERFTVSELQEQKCALLKLQKAKGGCKPAAKQIKRIDIWLEKKQANPKGKLSMFGSNPRCRQCGRLGPLSILSLMKREIHDKSLCCDGKCTGFSRSDYQDPKGNLDILNDPNLLSTLKNKRKRKGRKDRDFHKRMRNETLNDYSKTKYNIILDKNGQKLRNVEPYIFEFQTHIKNRWHKKSLLDMYCEEFSGNKRLYYQNALKLGLITINGTACTADQNLESGHLLCNLVHRHEPDILYVPAKDMIIAETENLLVVDKPASLTIHPSGAFRRNSLTFILAVESGYTNLYPIHRLDRHTSGIVLLAKNAEYAKIYCDAMRRKSQQFETNEKNEKIETTKIETKVRKVYLAQVEGKFPNTPDEIEKLNSKKLGGKIIKESCTEKTKKKIQVLCNQEASYLDKISIETKGIHWRKNNTNNLFPSSFKEIKEEDGHVLISWPIKCICKNTGVWECVKPDSKDVVEEQNEYNDENEEIKYCMSRIAFLGYDEKSKTSLVACEPITGRTHQLRVHLSFIGFPVCNDPLYGTNGNPLAGFTIRDQNAEQLECEQSKLKSFKKDSVNIEKRNTKTNDDIEILAKKVCVSCQEGTNVAFREVQLRYQGIDLHAYRYKIELSDGSNIDYKTNLPNFTKGFISNKNK